MLHTSSLALQPNKKMAMSWLIVSLFSTNVTIIEKQIQVRKHFLKVWRFLSMFCKINSCCLWNGTGAHAVWGMWKSFSMSLSYQVIIAIIYYLHCFVNEGSNPGLASLMANILCYLLHLDSTPLHSPFLKTKQKQSEWLCCTPHWITQMSDNNTQLRVVANQRQQQRQSCEKDQRQGSETDGMSTHKCDSPI